MIRDKREIQEKPSQKMTYPAWF